MKRILTLTIITALCLLMIAGCKKKDDESSTIGSVTDKPINITHWYWADNPVIHQKCGYR